MKVAIAGAGAVGRSIARELAREHHDVTLLERNPDHIDVDAIPAAHWRLGDACELSLLESVQLEEFDVVIAATGDDKVNVVVSLLAKTEFAVPRVVARVNDPRNEWLFDENWGVDVAVSTPRMLASLVEEAVAVGDLVRLMEFRKGQANLVEITLPDDTPWGGKPVKRLDLPRDAALVTILRGPQGDRAGGRRAARGRRRAAVRGHHGGRGRAARAAAASAVALSVSAGRRRAAAVVRSWQPAAFSGDTRSKSHCALRMPIARDEPGDREQRRRHQRALPETREIDLRRPNDHTGERDRDQARDPRHGVVDRRADAALRRIDRGQDRRRQRRHRHRQPEPEHHQARQHLRPEVERLARHHHPAGSRPRRSADRRP